MKQQRGRRNSKVVAAAEVVDLVSDSDEGPDSTPPAPTTTTNSNSRRTSRGRGRAAAAAASAAIAAGSAAQAAIGGDGEECELLDSDFELEAEQQRQQESSQAAQKSAPQGRKRALPGAGSSRPASGLGGARGKAAAAAAGGGMAPQPPAKRAETAAAAAAAGAKGGRANSSKGSKGLSSKQATAKGFNALFLCASQHAGGSQGSADAGSSQAAAAGTLQLTATSAALAAAAAAGGGGPATAAAAAGGGGGSSSHQSAELWVDRCVPGSVSDLVVHKKKVAEVQEWLTFYSDHRARHHTRALLVTGPPGCGKSVTVRVVAASMGYEVMEWTPPVPTLWADHQYWAGAGVRYTSKLDEFDMFVARAKFAALPLSSPTAPQQQQQQPSSQQPQQPSQPQQQQQQQQRPAKRQKLLLVEDLPHVADADRRARVASALRELATTARCPVVVVATTEEGQGGSRAGGGGGYGGYGGGGAGATAKGLHKDFVSVLEGCGAGSISFNPITGPNISKALAAIAAAEGYTLDPDLAQGIVAGAGGDLRNAIQNLQLRLQGPGAAKAKPAGAAGKKGKGSKAAPKRARKPSDPAAAAAAEAAQAVVTAQVARDQGLTVFHAIGKLLHYKRADKDGSSGAGASAAAAAGGGGSLTQQQQQQEGDEEDGDGDGMEVDGSSASQQGRLVQPPLRLNPEAIVQGSGLEALQVTSFLAENYTHFMVDDAVEEAAEAAAHLSDAAYMCCYRNSAAPSVAFWDEADPNAASLTSAAAVSVAARGLLWANRRPAPSRWLPLKGPSCFLPERAASTNMARLAGALQDLQDSTAAAAGGSRGQGVRQQDVMALAGQLLHAGRQDRAAQVLPYLQVLGRAPSRLWLHGLLPRSWAYLWAGSITERGSPALAGTGAAAVQAALQAAAAAAAGARGGGGGGGSQAAAGGGGGLGVMEEGEGGGEEGDGEGGDEEEEEEEESEQIESDSE